MGIIVLIAIPLLYLVVNIFFSPADWARVFNNIQPDYLINSLILIVGVGGLAFLFGVFPAWYISNYDFPGRRWLSWGLILPLAIPSYIIAYTYVGIFDYTGVVQVFLRSNFGEDLAKAWYFDIMHLGWLIPMLALVLFPYVFVATKAAFSMQSTNYLEAARSLGLSAGAMFRKVALPLARPAIAGGVFLVIMEVLNDYGAMKYYGIPTFTTEIFRSWFGREDGLSLAIKLSALLLIVVLIVVLVERWQRGKAQFTESAKPRPIARKKLRGWKGMLAFTFCVLPFLFGFAIPVAQLIAWVTETASEVVDLEFLLLLANSFGLALVSALVIVVASIIIIYSYRVNRSKAGQWMARFAVVGYAIPGAIIAVGVIGVTTSFDGGIDALSESWFGSGTGLLLTGTLVALVLAYLIRFLAVGFNSIEGSYDKLGKNFSEAGRSLGLSPLKALLKIDLPLLKPALIGAAIVAFVDLLKELPLTLILRPFDFDTLATKAYELASDEQLAESANAALVIIIVGIIPILILHKFVLQKK